MVAIAVIIGVMFALSGCTAPHLKSAQNKNFSQLSFAGSATAYYLPPRPLWAQFSSEGECFYPRDPYFIDFEKAGKSFNLTYAQLVSLQVTLNLMAQPEVGGSSPAWPEDALFFSALEKVEGKTSEFTLPDFDAVAIIWVDSFLDRPSEWWREMWNSPLLMKAVPLFVSLCQSHHELELWAHQMNVPFQIYILGRESLNLFTGQDFSRRAHLGLDFNQLFKPQTKIDFISKAKKASPAFVGKMNFHSW